MIDRQARDANALALRRLGAGNITNWEYEELLVESTYDQANWYIHYYGGWRLYSDGHEPEFVRLNRFQKREVARWVVFLHSDYEYEWPHEKYGKSGYELVKRIFHLLSLDILKNSREKFGSDEYKRCGDFKYWPFISRDSYKIALLNHKYFSGGTEGV